MRITLESSTILNIPNLLRLAQRSIRLGYWADDFAFNLFLLELRGADNSITLDRAVQLISNAHPVGHTVSFEI